MIITIFGTFIILILLNVPIALVLGGTSIFALATRTHTPLTIVLQQYFNGIDSASLLAIPLFILAGNLMATGGISKRLVDFANVLVGRFKGGLGYVAVISCIFFGAISGSGPATTAAIGTVMVPYMKKKGYSAPLSLALVASAGLLGVLIPPSIPMVVYGVTAGVSISKLFLAGVGPGLLLGGFLMVAWAYFAKKYDYVQDEPSTLKETWVSFKNAITALLMPVIILGGIYSGIFTATEAAAVACVYSLFISMVVFKELKFSDLRKVAYDTATSTGTIALLLANAVLFGWLLVTQQIPQNIAAWVTSLTTNPYIILFAFNIFLLILGCLVNTTAAIVLVTPIFLPTLLAVGLDPLFIGVVMVVNLAIGMITPPVGLNLFVASGLDKDVGLSQIVKANTLFLVVLVIGLMLVTYIPAISLALPNILMH